jgi:hypothetical protein
MRIATVKRKNRSQVELCSVAKLLFLNLMLSLNSGRSFW